MSVTSIDSNAHFVAKQTDGRGKILRSLQRGATLVRHQHNHGSRGDSGELLNFKP